MREGLAAVGINAIAAESGADKVLIYRYFGGLDGVLAAIASERRLWPELEEQVRGASSLAAAARAYASTLGSELRQDGAALTREVLRASLGRARGTIVELTAPREAEHGRVTAAVREGRTPPPFIDVEALLALLLSGVTLLALARDGGERVFGLDPASNTDWKRVDRVLGTITRALLEPSDV